MKYEPLTNEEGVESFPRVFTLFPTTDANFFIDPFGLRRLRYRAYFEKTTRSLKQELRVYFHLTPKENEGLSISNYLTDEIYLYGAFNEINVVQIKSRGVIEEILGESKEQFLAIIKDQLTGENISRIGPGPSKDDIRNALNDLSTEGYVYCFTPIDYMFSTYERG